MPTILYLTLALTVLANLLYHLFSKMTSPTVNVWLSLIITYITALIISVILFLVTSKNVNIFEELKKINFASFWLGVAIVGLETGFILAYKAGWEISTLALISNIILTLILIPIGIVFFKDKINIQNFIGIVFCIIGLLLIRYKIK